MLGGWQLDVAIRRKGQADLQARLPFTLLFTGLGNVWDHVKAGKLNLLAVTEDRRSQLLPNLPRVDKTLPFNQVGK